MQVNYLLIHTNHVYIVIDKKYVLLLLLTTITNLYIFVKIAGTNGFRRAEYSNTMKQMYKDKEKFKEHIQLNNLHKRTKREIQQRKHKAEEAKEVERKIPTVEQALLFQQLTKV